jgi:hypothetical protein
MLPFRSMFSIGWPNIGNVANVQNLNASYDHRLRMTKSSPGELASVTLVSALIVLALVGIACMVGSAIDGTEKDLGLAPPQKTRTVKIDYCVHDLELSL